ncbi:MAG: phosphate-starvation-inducible PsiE family protein [Caldisphaeraceae archaeon]|nr:phosphate-starvation-inducible PsiE family protein [Caldisphaeraceae archaeon]MEB3691880.1 phosphate-starvation-inducible PsiE family protein [Caldisphaeraceae archaeon]MEB3798146.1 phosphate-starvation-inducible PsiE family protein [Caldisphaeraceae archaeon]
MESYERSDKREKRLFYLVGIGEILVAIILILTVVIGSLITISSMLKMFYVGAFNKNDILNLIDTSLILLIAVDLLRTVVVGFSKRSIPIKTVVEAGLIVVIRQMIANSLLNGGAINLVFISISFILVVIGWVIVSRYSSEKV